MLDKARKISSNIKYRISNIREKNSRFDKFLHLCYNMLQFLQPSQR